MSDTILLDSIRPLNGTVTATDGASGTVNVGWSGFSDASSGLDGYKVVYRVGSAPSTCTSGTVAGDHASGSSLAVSGLVSGTSYGFRVCAYDVAGNLSSGTGPPVAP
ncbi:MAG: fibronectin type III domain-containing protein [Myxococcota bacterium]